MSSEPPNPKRVDETIIYDPDGDVTLVFPKMEYWYGCGVGGSNEDSEPTGEWHKELVEVHLLMSSKHLAFASPVFKTMFKSKFREGTELREGKAKIHLPEDDLYLMDLIMTIIHGKSRQVADFGPLNLEKLFDLALLVEKYGFNEAVEGHINRWLPPLADKIPRASLDTLLGFMTIAWVFHETYAFAAVTARFMVKSCAIIQEDHFGDLPVPQKIIATLKTLQRYAIEVVYGTAENMLQFQEPKYDITKVWHQERSYTEAHSLSTINYELQIILVLLGSAEKLGLVRESKRAHHFHYLVVDQCKNFVGGYKNTVYTNHSEYNDDQETTIIKNFDQVGGPLNRRLDHLEVAIYFTLKKYVNDMADTANPRVRTVGHEMWKFEERIYIPQSVSIKIVEMVYNERFGKRISWHSDVVW